MITRLRIKGFKNIIDAEFYFGPFNCLAGLNGVGKSNLFDALMFLSALADKPFVEAARSVRGGDDMLRLRSGNEPGPIEFDLDVIIPPKGTDEFNQEAVAGGTYLNYKLAFDVGSVKREGYESTVMELTSEELTGYPRSYATTALKFNPSKAWVNSVVKPMTRRRTFIKTEGDRILLQADRMKVEDKKWRGGGKPNVLNARILPRTVLSSAQNADENRTAVLMRKELRSWKRLQFEPSALGSQDEFDAPTSLDSKGAHIPATLYRLASEGDREATYTKLANRLAQLVEGVKSTHVERDDSRRVFRFMMEDLEGLELPASSLSDGTLRFVALATIWQDSAEHGLICFEEPENGIHPQKVDAMVDLLYEIATDAETAVDDNAPLRQVIITTHSPLVVERVDLDDLTFIETKYARVDGRRVGGIGLAAPLGSWRAQVLEPINKATVKRYLSGRPLIDPPKRDKPTLLSTEQYQTRLKLD
ncbi:MAG: AAA family ATPase [Flavobacteriales bacterium]|nr:MAG: AAA family ATPase [Flavobacteriales bacterium]